MKQPLLALLLTLAAVFALAGDESGSAECARVYADAMESDLGLSYEAFDQTRGQGFRRLSELGCRKEAADLIEAYMAATGASQRSLTWHIAQLRAGHGDYDSALQHARLSLIDPADTGASTLRWNDYVLAVIAFLEKDRPALVRHRARVAEGDDEHAGNVMNGRILDALIANFDKTYSEAIASTAR